MSDVIYNISSGFYDSVNGDRLYSAADMNKPYKRVIADGIFPTPQGTPSTDFQVVAVSGMSVAVLAGNAMIGARWAENTDDVGITIAGNSSSSPRIDSIFLHIDTGMDTRAAGVVYRQGTAAGTPTAPAMVQTDNITELRLADILVAPSAAIITQANITDQRGGSDCPWVAGLIQQVDTSALFDQYRAAYAEQQQDQANEWNTFMDHLARDYDISMSLRKHESTYTSTSAASLIPINIDGYDTTKDLLQVYINGIFAVEGTHYIVKSATQIQLTNAISAGQKVHFVIYKAVMGGAQPIIPTDEQVQDAVDAYMDAHPGALVVDPELSDTSTHAIQNKAVTEAIENVNGRLHEVTTNLTLLESSNHSLSDESWTSGYYLSNSNNANGGNPVASSTYSYSDYIPAEEGDIVRLWDLYNGSFAQRQMYTVTAYDADKSYVYKPDSVSWKQTDYTVQSGIAFVRISTKTATNYMVTINQTVTEYEPYYEPHYEATAGFIHVEIFKNVGTPDLKNQYACALPKRKLRQTVGLNQKWYKKSMITPETNLICVNAGYNFTTAEEDGFVISNTSASTGNNGYVWYAYDGLFNQIFNFDYGTGWGAPMVRQAENLSGCSLLAIGDSTIDIDHITGKLLSYFTEKGKTITLLGTLGKSTEPLNKNEGRAGWTTSDYMGNTTKNGYTNPFYNPSTEGFDFSYYMSQQGYTNVDFVVIQLGINDLYPSQPRMPAEPDYASIYANIKTMIDSILSFNSSVKIIVNLPMTPNSNPSAHRIQEFLYRHYVIRYNEIALAGLMAYSETNVRVSYCHLLLDPATDISDNVHPTVAGYEKMALEIVNQINCWQNGV